MGPTWGPRGSCRPQMGPMWAPWTLLSGMLWSHHETNNWAEDEPSTFHSCICIIQFLKWTIIKPILQPALKRIPQVEQFWWSLFSLCNHVTLYGLVSPRLLHSLNDHIKSSHSFKHGCNNGRWVVLYALVSPQWSHAWFWGRVRTILFPATKLCPCGK